MFAVLALPSGARAQVTAYTDEAAFQAALVDQGFPALVEGFEDDAVWGDVRTTVAGGPQTAPWIHSQGLTWEPNNPASEITTGEGPARTGQWGFFELPHGDWTSGVRDGFGATGDQPLVAIGGWIETNTPFAKIGLYLDGVPVDFGGAGTIGTQHEFFGAIDPRGFSHFEYLEQEATPDDWKLVFADDFTFAFGGTLIDCNRNGVADSLDIESGFSEDCNSNGVPDECEIHESSTASGGPFYCTEDCDPDCNDNGLLDECEAVTARTYSSGQLSPIGDGFPQSFLIDKPPPSQSDVILTFAAHANLGGPDEYLDVDINGVPVGTVFALSGSDCSEGAPDAARLVVARDTFNKAVAGGSARIGLVASAEVDAFECDAPSHVTVELTLFVPSDQDADGDGQLDECQILRFCRPKTSSLGCTPLLGFTGLPTLTGADDFFVTAADIVGQTSGTLLWSLRANPNGSALGVFQSSRLGSFNCLLRPRPLGTQGAGGSAGSCSGTFAFHVSQAFFAAQGLTPGTPLFVQAFYDDPGHPDGSGIGHTDALQIAILP